MSTRPALKLVHSAPAPESFDGRRQAMLRAFNDMIADGSSAEDLQAEIEGTTTAMRLLVELARNG